MSTDSHPRDADAPADDRDAAGERPPHDRRYVARIERYDDAPSECTIHPVGADIDELATTWISAEGDSYVSLAKIR